MGLCPAALLMFTMLPRLARSADSAACATKVVPYTLASNWRRTSSSLDCSRGAKRKTPALLTTTSSLPASLTALATAALTSFELATSARSQRMSGCRPRASSSASCRRAIPKTVAPASWNATAIASPIPELAPVTRTTLPSNAFAMGPFLSTDLCCLGERQDAPARSVAVPASKGGDYCAQVTNRVVEDGCPGEDGHVRSRRRGRQLLGCGKAASHLACRGQPPDQHSRRRAARSAASTHDPQDVDHACRSRLLRALLADPA